MMSAAQQSVVALRYSRALSRAILARSRGLNAQPGPVQGQFALGDQVLYWRGHKNEHKVKKSAWVIR